MFILKIYKGLLKKLFYNYYGSYRVVEKFSLVYYRFRICSNKLVSFIVYVNRLIEFFTVLVEDTFFFIVDDFFLDSFVSLREERYIMRDAESDSFIVGE